MGSVHELLTRHGIRVSEEEIARAMEVVLVESGFQRPYPDPRRALERDEAERLERGGFGLDRLAFGLEDPIARTAFEYAVLRATALTTSEAAERLGVDESRVRQRLRNRALYGLKTGVEWRLPAFQFARAGLVPGIDRVFPRLPKSLSPVAVRRWFHTPSLDLEETEEQGRALTPLQWLLAGNDPDVVAQLGRWPR
jgi:excisionase family DNA binding protein